MTNLVYFVNHI